MKKMPNCKMCDGTGNVHIDATWCVKIMDIPCWKCGASNFKGMSREQITWYLKMDKAFDLVKGKSLRAGTCIAPESWLKMKNAINLACSRLGIEMPSIPFVKAINYGEVQEFVTLKEELKAYEKRLRAIPAVMSAKTV